MRKEEKEPLIKILQLFVITACLFGVYLSIGKEAKMIRPMMECDNTDCSKEIEDQATALKVIKTEIYGYDTVLHFCNYSCLRKWIEEQMEDENSVSLP